MDLAVIVISRYFISNTNHAQCASSNALFGGSLFQMYFYWFLLSHRGLNNCLISFHLLAGLLENNEDNKHAMLAKSEKRVVMWMLNFSVPKI